MASTARSLPPSPEATLARRALPPPITLRLHRRTSSLPSNSDVRARSSIDHAVEFVVHESMRQIGEALMGSAYQRMAAPLPLRIDALERPSPNIRGRRATRKGPLWICLRELELEVLVLPVPAVPANPSITGIDFIDIHV